MSARGKAARLVLRGLGAAGRARPIPLRVVLRVREFARDAGALDPHVVPSTGATLRDPFLAKHLATMELGAWSLDAHSLELIGSLVQTVRPQTVLEFGSGVSTVCLARYLTNIHGRDPVPRVFAVEQDDEQASLTGLLASDMELGPYVRIHVAPLKTYPLHDRMTVIYDLDSELLMEFLGEAQPGLVLIDGPSGPPGCRAGTLSLIRAVVGESTPFILDDALRDGELDIARAWSRLPGIKIDGIYLVGKGLLVGSIART